jgi:predicted kinase
MSNTHKSLILVRGLPGAGKSTFAKSLRGQHFEADQFFIGDDGVYRWDGMQIGEAHVWCQTSTELAMELRYPLIVVSNTFTTEKELKPYLNMARKHNYQTTVLIVENRNSTESVHNVPPEVIEKMRARFSVRL